MEGMNRDGGMVRKRVGLVGDRDVIDGGVVVLREVSFQYGILITKTRFSGVIPVHTC